MALRADRERWSCQWRWFVSGRGRRSSLPPDDMDRSSLEWVFQLQWAGFILHGVFLLSAVVVVMNLERTFRAAVGTMRWRIKFMVLGLSILFAVRAYTCSQALLWRKMDPSLVAVDCGGLVLGCLLILRSLFRDTSEVAVFPSKDILKNSFTALVAGIYLVCVGFLAKLPAWVQGFEAKAFLLLIALVAVTVVALSDRVRMHTRRFISRYFQRPVLRLSHGLADADGGHYFACQTTGPLPGRRHLDLRDFPGALGHDMAGGRNQGEPGLCGLDLLVRRGGRRDAAAEGGGDGDLPRRCKSSGPGGLRDFRGRLGRGSPAADPTGFRTGGSRVCVPLIGGGQLLGVIALGDRVGGIFFSLQDFDLLRCVGDQVAAGLLNAQLSQKLLQAKELEAFQTMSAFFVHDLKNTASTLNLMLQNLPDAF